LAGTITDYATSTSTITSTGNQLVVGSQSSTQTVGNFVTDVALQPYIASRIISFIAYNMRPNQRMHIFFDSVLVDQYCAPAVNDVSGNYQTTVSNTSDYKSIPKNGNWGTAIYSDANGIVAGQFQIPEATFRTGERVMQIADVTNLAQGSDAYTTTSSASFVASNLSVTKQTVTLTSVNPTFSYQPIQKQVTTTNTTVTATRTDALQTILNVTVYYEPIAQGLTINTYNNEPGIYATSLDIFFKQKSTDTTHGITVYLCEINNGYPDGSNILPFSTTHLNNSEIFVSDNASVPTTFVFESPVFMSNGKEYAFIVKPDNNDPDFYVFSAELGKTDITTGAQVYSQPVVGTAFEGATMNQWTTLPTEYIKFDLRRASFLPNSSNTLTGQAIFNNSNTDYVEVYNVAYVNTTAGIIPGDHLYFCDNHNFNVIANTAGYSNSLNILYIGSANTYISVNDRVFYNVPTGNTAISGLTANTYYYVSFVNSSSVALSTTVSGSNVDITGSVTSAGEVHYLNTVKANQSVTGIINYYDSIKSIFYINDSTGNFRTNSFVQVHRFANTTAATSPGPNNTTLVAYANTSGLYNAVLDAFVPQFATITPSGTTLSFKYKGISNTYVMDSTEYPITVGATAEFLDQERIVASKTNEVNNGSSEKSMTIRSSFTSDSDYISPLVDTIRYQELVIGNRVDPVSFNYQELINGNAKSAYISEVITLAPGQDAQDIQVLISAWRPPSSDIKVYVKFLNGDDTDSMSAKTWTPLINQNSNFFSDPSSPGIFNDFTFTVGQAYGMIPVSGTIAANSVTGTSVVGTGTAFTTELQPGWFINVKANSSFQETTRQVISITDDTHLTLDHAFNGNYTSGTQYFLAVPPTTAWLSTNTSIQLTGTVSTSITNNSIIGSSTKFTTELMAGETISINNDEQVVVSIANDTFLSVGTPWSSTTTGNTAYLISPNGITYLNSNLNLYSKFLRFQIKIVLQSDDSSRVPILDSLRTLALQM